MNTTCVIVSALCITLLEIIAICKGKNGLLLRMAMVLLGALGGLSLAALLRLK